MQNAVEHLRGFSTIAVVDGYDGAAVGSGRRSCSDYDDMEWDRSLELVGGRNQSVRLLRGTCLELADETEQLAELDDEAFAPRSRLLG